MLLDPCPLTERSACLGQVCSMLSMRTVEASPMATGIFAIASPKQLAGSMQQHTDAAANQRAVDADVLQIRPDLQFDAA